MAPDRTSRNGGFSLPAKRNSALATAAMASAALLSQTANAAADEGPSRDEVSRRVTNLYDRAEDDSGTYNATRAARTASSTRDRTGSPTGGGSRAGGDPALDDIAKQWYGMARAKTGPMVEATLPSDRVANRRAETSSRRPAGGSPAARDPKPAERSVPELTAKPVLALPTAPEQAPAALTAAPAQSPAWAPEPAPQDLTGTGESPALGTSPLVTGVPEYIPQPVTELPPYTGQPDTGFREYTAAPTGTSFPQYSPQIGTGYPEPTGQLGTALPEYTASTTTGFTDYSGQLGTGLPEYATPAATGFPEYPAQTTTGFPEYPAQTTTGFPEYPAQTTTGFPEYSTQTALGYPEYSAQSTATAGSPDYPVPTTTGLSQIPAQATTGYPEYSALTAPLAAITPRPVDTTQSTPLIPSPRTPEPSWQASQPTTAPAATPLTLAPALTPALPTTDADLPAPDPGYDSKVIQVLAFARSQIGKPCLWGAAGPGSYDNSGLTQAAWKVAGVSLPRTSLGQASSGTAVPLYAMQPGDLVFFHDDFSHVGLCTGNGMMIHAPGPGSSIREESIYPTGESIIRGAVRPA